MSHEASPSKLTIALLALFLVSSLACNGLIPRPEGDATAERTEPIGFEFIGRLPESPEGDEAAPNHVFIHGYPVPGDGSITGVIYLNDADEISETITLLILRLVSGGWEVIHHVTLPDDDRPPATSGISTIELSPPLIVREGDLFGHWQPEARPTGAVPLNLDDASVDGLSVGKFGFSSAEVQVGQIIEDRGFTGRRDYSMNITFKPTP